MITCKYCSRKANVVVKSSKLRSLQIRTCKYHIAKARYEFQKTDAHLLTTQKKEQLELTK